MKISRLIAIPLCLVLALCSCGRYEDGVVGAQETGQGGASAEQSASPQPDEASAAPADAIFSLAYSPDDSLNPFTATSTFNLLVTQLLYEGLFELDGSFSPVPDLCSGFSTADFQNYDITVAAGRLFSDGTELAAADVAYSLDQARASERYKSRLAGIGGVTVTGTYALSVSLSEPNRNFPALLDVPVVKNGSADEYAPAGTAGYKFVRGGEYSCLRAADSGGGLPIGSIYLQEIPGLEQLPSAFESSLVDLVEYDPTGSAGVEYAGDYETTYYDTTVMHFLGFNQKGVFSNAKLRLAASYLVDRQTLASEVMQGHALASALPVSPASPLFNSELDAVYAYSAQKASALFGELGLSDSDHDGVLDYGDKKEGLEAVFIVNNENAYKLACAKKIAEALNAAGVCVELKELSWSDYIEALEDGAFDMYYGEVMLTADFDLDALIVPGGSLNYGKASDAQYASFKRAYETAAAGDAPAARYAYLNHMAQDAAVAPVMFKKKAVLVRRGTAAGVGPAQGGIFRDFSDWVISVGQGN